MKTYFKGPKNGPYQMTPIAFVESPFKDKYGVPRQPILADNVQGKIKFVKDPDLVTAIKMLEGYSHLWVVFIFHSHGGKNWKPSIRPPKLGGRKKVGVLASRSPHRPNPIGISVVKIEEIISKDKDSLEILISGIDLVDGTPVLDVKPYLPYTDALPDAHVGWSSGEIKKHPVQFSKAAIDFIHTLKSQSKIQESIKQILEIDPRPAYQQREKPIDEKKTQGLSYGIEIAGYEVKYRIQDFGIYVFDIFIPEDR